MAGGQFGVVRRQANFVGNYTHVVDAQGRIQVPRAMRKAMLPEALGTFFVTRGLDGCLSAYPLDTWLNLSEQWETILNDAPAVQRRSQIRIITSNAYETKMDGQGRITVPAQLLEAAAITSEAVFAGASYRIEIWEPERFRRAISEAEGSFEQTAQNLMTFHANRQRG
jgi:MraZ protein